MHWAWSCINSTGRTSVNPPVSVHKKKNILIWPYLSLKKWNKTTEVRDLVWRLLSPLNNRTRSRRVKAACTCSSIPGWETEERKKEKKKELQMGESRSPDDELDFLLILHCALLYLDRLDFRCQKEVVRLHHSHSAVLLLLAAHQSLRQQSAQVPRRRPLSQIQEEQLLPRLLQEELLIGSRQSLERRQPADPSDGHEQQSSRRLLIRPICNWNHNCFAAFL